MIDCYSLCLTSRRVSFFTALVGITTMVGGGTGPAHGTRATTCTPGHVHMELMLQSTDEIPLNFGFTGKVSLFALVLLMKKITE